ncbi:MAG: hypothetical protein HY304_02200, partial [candidate division Zixibacteria bacterium]|nr:hypothetical protein [candidate division Zixibacteria bacterium]
MMSPLLLLNHMIGQEEGQVAGHLQDAFSDIHRLWLASPPSERGLIPLDTVMAQYRLARLWLSTYDKDTLGGRWLFRSVQGGMKSRFGWDSALAAPPIMPAEPGADQIQVLRIADEWAGQPILGGAAIAAPAVA